MLLLFVQPEALPDLRASVRAYISSAVQVIEPFIACLVDWLIGWLASVTGRWLAVGSRRGLVGILPLAV